MDIQMDDVNEYKLLLEGNEGCLELVHNENLMRLCNLNQKEAAEAYYDDYARRIGFLTRVISSRKSERDGSIISRRFGCRGNCDNRSKVQSEKQDKRQESCMAMILLKREKPGRWVVRKCVRNHNHPLVAQLQKCRRTPDEKGKKIFELTAELRVKKKLSATYGEQLITFVKDVEDHNAHLSTKVQLVFENLKILEAEAQALSQRG